MRLRGLCVDICRVSWPPPPRGGGGGGDYFFLRGLDTCVWVGLEPPIKHPSKVEPPRPHATLPRFGQVGSLSQLGVYMPGSEAPAGTLNLSSRTNRPPAFVMVATSSGSRGRGTSLPGSRPRGGQFPGSAHPSLSGDPGRAGSCCTVILHSLFAIPANVSQNFVRGCAPRSSWSGQHIALGPGPGWGAPAVVPGELGYDADQKHFFIFFRCHGPCQVKRPPI